MPRLGGFYGVAGVILLVFAGIAYFLTRTVSTYVFLHTLLGLLALIAYFASSKDSVRTFLGERSTKYGANAALYSVLAFGVLVLLNYLGTQYYHRFDLTEAGVYSLSPQSKKLVEELEQTLEVNAFVQAGIDPQLEDLLGSYAYASDKVSYTIVDPDTRPDLAERFQITNIPAVHMQYAERDECGHDHFRKKGLLTGLLRSPRLRPRLFTLSKVMASPALMTPNKDAGMGSSRSRWRMKAIPSKSLS